VKTDLGHSGRKAAVAKLVLDGKLSLVVVNMREQRRSAIRHPGDGLRPCRPARSRRSKFDGAVGEETGCW